MLRIACLGEEGSGTRLVSMVSWVTGERAAIECMSETWTRTWMPGKEGRGDTSEVSGRAERTSDRTSVAELMMCVVVVEVSASNMRNVAVEESQSALLADSEEAVLDGGDISQFQARCRNDTTVVSLDVLCQGIYRKSCVRHHQNYC